MVFSSHLFLFVFLPFALLLYYVSPRRVKHLTLTLLSYVFYGWSNPLFCVLLLTSTLVDYVCGLVIAGQGRLRFGAALPLLEKGGSRHRSQRIALIASLLTNLSLLGFFKYFNFAVDTYDAMLRALGFQGLGLESVLRITLPLGISFYTFQSMSYTIDVYRGTAQAIRNPIDFACYVSMFPQLVAGPIIRFSEVAEQLESRRHTLSKFARGCALFSLGFAKKILIANPCGKVADLAFNAGSVGSLDAWYGVTAYAFQIYYDFSGYSDMAIGLGLMLGFVYPKNFDSPYIAQSITDFWRRWHISLSSWLRDYLYIPLGGNRKGEGRTYVNLAVVMLLGGLWHGAAWNFVVWGGIHGVFLAWERAMGKKPLYASCPACLRIAATFLIVLVAWVFFRAHDLGHAFRYLGSMAGLGQPGPGNLLIQPLARHPYYVGTFLLAAAVTWAGTQSTVWTRRLTFHKVMVLLGLFAIGVVAMTTQGFNPFIYFIF